MAMALPRKGHMEQVYHVFGYLKTHSKHRLFFDPRHPDIDECAFTNYEWYDFYRDASEQIPNDMPPPPPPPPPPPGMLCLPTVSSMQIMHQIR